MRSLASALPPGESMRTTTAFTSSSFSSWRERAVDVLLDDAAATAEQAVAARRHRDAARRADERDRARSRSPRPRARARCPRGRRPSPRRPTRTRPRRERRSTPSSPRRARRPRSRPRRRARAPSRAAASTARPRRPRRCPGFVAPLRDRLEPRGAHVGEHAGERRARLGARPVARERLLGALELADLQHVDREVQLVGEETAHVEDLRGETDRLDLAGRRHVDARAAAGRGHHRRVRERVAVAVDLLLRLELLEVLADLLRARGADAGARRTSRGRRRSPCLVPTSVIACRSSSKLFLRPTPPKRLAASCSGTPPLRSRMAIAGPVLRGGSVVLPSACVPARGRPSQPAARRRSPRRAPRGTDEPERPTRHPPPPDSLGAGARTRSGTIGGGAGAAAGAAGLDALLHARGVRALGEAIDDVLVGLHRGRSVPGLPVDVAHAHERGHVARVDREYTLVRRLVRR